ncbi:hypothetical protein ABE504_23825 [Paenibacillus oryzisoli]|uniref:hypothetical protein n=1 Tax=Paenibacillus oryzisoli TaxID=1850517 RepID=UPI003D2C8ABD
MNNIKKFIEEMTLRVCPKLEIREFTIAEETMRKPIIEEADFRPNFAKEYLEQGFVEFPIYRTITIAPLSRGGKFCDYTVKRLGLGNLVEITQSYGDLEINPQDSRYLKRACQYESRVFRFCYDYNEKRFKLENNSERWEKLLDEAMEWLFHEEVNKALWGFIDFYHDFWIERETFNYKRKLTPIVTLLDLKEFCHYLWHQCAEMVDYFTILSMFGEISDSEKAVLVEIVTRLQSEVDDLHMYLNAQVFIHEKRLDDFYLDHEHNRRVRKLEETIKRAMKPGFYVDPTKQELYRNVGQYYASMKPTKDFFNAETMKALKERLVRQAQKALLIKGTTEVESFDDLQFIFLDL